ncbi:MAG: Wzz/FepE/Etk N-terminal domain-containing protein, partial [Paracoccaceae bacterium]|nr:Wzz/FepE/Etk N-terminal domain-containing protein [Paracoccaceae bacterium]
MGQIQTLDDLIGLLVRRRLLIGVVAVFGVVISLLYVMGRPDVFESAAVIQVQTPTVTDDTAANPASLSAQRLQTIEQRLTTRENMLAVIARHGLYAGLPLTDDEKVYLLRLAVRFQSVASAAAPAFGAPQMVSALIIFARADTSEKAARVANDFAQSVVDAGVEGQTGKAREAVSFFREEEQRLSAQIQALDAEIAAYKNANLDALPAQRDLRRDEIVGLEVELRAIDQTLVRLMSEREVITNKANQRETDRRQIDTLTGQVESLTAQKSALTAQRALVEAALLRTPEVEQVLVGYDRRLDRLQSQFQVLTRRVAEADTAQKLEERQQGESFTMLERAVAPENPISGGRRKLAVV